MGENVLLTRDGLIATVTLNRPDRRNSLSDPMLTELGAAFAELRDDASTRVVIVTGAPPVFSAGADAGLKSSMSAEERRQAMGSRKSQFRRLFERANTVLENLEQTTIAAINGHAVGGGWGLTLACDFRIASAEAQLWIPEVDLGVPLGVASTTRFVRMVGPARAKEIIMRHHLAGPDRDHDAEFAQQAPHRVQARGPCRHPHRAQPVQRCQRLLRLRLHGHRADLLIAEGF